MAFVRSGQMRVYCRIGEVSERLKELVSKTSVPFRGTAGSNPALSVISITG